MGFKNNLRIFNFKRFYFSFIFNSNGYENQLLLVVIGFNLAEKHFWCYIH